MMSVVDVRDYGAKGDGTTDDTTAFEAADAVANGRTILVSEGSF
jgi:polygalacturonase